MQTSLKLRIAALAALGAITLSLGAAHAADEPRRPECIAPAQPGGGFDLTCRLATEGLKQSGALKNTMRIVYMPGGIGAVAYNNIVAQHPNEPGTIVAFSGGSLLNLAQGKFGKYNVNDVRWLAAIGTDYGVAVVRNDSPYTDLKGLMEAFKQDPTKIVLGAGGTVGSQDWMKAALTAKAAGVDFKKMRFVAFEGGGEAVTALRGGHIQAYMGDAAEAFTMLEGAPPSACWPSSTTSACRASWARCPPPRNRATTSSGPSSAASTSVPRCPTATTSSGSTRSTRRRPRPSSTSCASSRVCSPSTRPAPNWTPT